MQVFEAYSLLGWSVLPVCVQNANLVSPVRKRAQILSLLSPGHTPCSTNRASTYSLVSAQHKVAPSTFFLFEDIMVIPAASPSLLTRHVCLPRRIA